MPNNDLGRKSVLNVSLLIAVALNLYFRHSEFVFTSFSDHEISPTQKNVIHMPRISAKILVIVLWQLPVWPQKKKKKPVSRADNLSSKVGWSGVCFSCFVFFLISGSKNDPRNMKISKKNLTLFSEKF